jgi:hypothetical protein
MQQLNSNFAPFGQQGFGFQPMGGASPFGQSFSPAGIGQGMGGAQMQMMNAMMTQMMNSLTQILQVLMGMGQGGGGALSPMSNFGGQGGGASGGGLNNFLGGGGGGGGTPSAGGGSGNSGAVGGSSPASGSASTSSSSGVSADLPEGVKGLTFAKAAELVKKGGGEVNPGGRPTVLALRSKTAASATYQDSFVVLKPDGTLQPFSANTRPTTSGQDRAMLKPGAYEISPRWRDGKYNNDAFLVKSKSGSMTVGVGRDSNGDGAYSQQEMNGNTSSSLIRLHRGNGDRTSSTGCLNVRDYDGFLGAVGGRDASFNLVLVNLN